MKFCPECGNNIEGQKFCSECGYKVSGNDSFSKQEKLNEEKEVLKFSTYLFGMDDKKKTIAKGFDLSLPREKYTLTSQRILIEKQTITTKREEIELTDIDKVDVNQGMKDKLLKVGDIVINLKDGTEKVFKRLQTPFEIKDAIRKEVNARNIQGNIEYRMDL